LFSDGDFEKGRRLGRTEGVQFKVVFCHHDATGGRGKLEKETFWRKGTFRRRGNRGARNEITSPQSEGYRPQHPKIVEHREKKSILPSHILEGTQT